MSILSIKSNVENVGEAQEKLRKIIGELNFGHKKGPGWIFGDEGADIEADAPARNEKLESLTLDLQRIVLDEDITDEKLREASESLLPSLCKALTELGYGADSSVDGPGDTVKEGLDKTPDGEKTLYHGANFDQSDDIKGGLKPGETVGVIEKVEEKPEKKFKLPWEK